jgi:hypothetical protein
MTSSHLGLFEGMFGLSKWSWSVTISVAQFHLGKASERGFGLRRATRVIPGWVWMDAGKKLGWVGYMIGRLAILHFEELPTGNPYKMFKTIINNP